MAERPLPDEDPLMGLSLICGGLSTANVLLNTEILAT
jgi:hypothetical protein